VRENELQANHWDLTFHGTKVNVFGDFRTKDVWFDSYPHEMMGAEPGKIEEELIKFYDDYFEGFDPFECKREIFLRKCAVFLENFFRVHPFPDGNGRVGRLFLILMAENSFEYYFERFDIHGKNDEKEYIKALRHAHKFHDHPDPHKRRDAYKLLIKWLDSRLIERKSFSGEEEPPS
jgi:fido (protein-threonine AMPylation protein)